MCIRDSAGAIGWMLLTNMPRAGSRVDWYAAFLGISLFTIYLASLKWIHPRIILLFSIWLFLASLVFVENLIRGEASLWYNAGGVALMIFSSMGKFGQYRRLLTIGSREAAPPSMSNHQLQGAPGTIPSSSTDPEDRRP